MKKSQFSEEQKIGILRQVRAGRTVVAVCREHNIGVQTYYGWKREYGTMLTLRRGVASDFGSMYCDALAWPHQKLAYGQLRVLTASAFSHLK
jgi:hypothetical protein